MCDGKRDLGVHENALGCDTTCMKDGYFTDVNIDRFSPFWLVNIIDSNGRRRPYGNRSTMSVCILGGNFNLFRDNNEEVQIFVSDYCFLKTKD